MGYLKRRQFRMSDDDMLLLTAETVNRNHRENESRNRSDFIRLLIQEEAKRQHVTPQLAAKLATEYTEFEGKRGGDAAPRAHRTSKRHAYSSNNLPIKRVGDKSSNNQYDWYYVYRRHSDNTSYLLPTRELDTAECTLIKRFMALNMEQAEMIFEEIRQGNTETP